MRLGHRVLRHLDEKLAHERTTVEDRDAQLREIFASCGSPLEQRFLVYFVRRLAGFAYDPSDWQGRHILIPGWGGRSGPDLRIFPQYPIERSARRAGGRPRHYRADFFVVLSRSNSVTGQIEVLAQLVVEIDGHDYHERTKQQAARDRSRDRFMTAAGLRVRCTTAVPSGAL